MKTPKTKLFLKLFFYTGFLFGLLFVLLDLIADGHFSIVKFLFVSIFFGFFFTISILSIVSGRLKDMGIDEITEDVLKVRQEKILKDVPVTKSELMQLLKEDEKFEKAKIHEEQNKIIIKTKISWYSWGEIIEIVFPTGDVENNEIVIKSKPSFKFTFVDYGKNYENVKYIERIIDKYSGKVIS